MGAASAPRTNVSRLVASSVAGQVSHPVVRVSPYRIGRDGVLRLLPGSGGIVLNRRVGDRAVGLAADHMEAGVSIHNTGRDDIGADAPRCTFLGHMPAKSVQCRLRCLIGGERRDGLVSGER